LTERSVDVSRSKTVPTRLALALAGATAVVAAEFAALALSTRLSAAALAGVVPASVPSIPVVAVSVGALGFVVGVRRRVDDGAPLALSGAVLVVAAPVTAFGGGCGVAGGSAPLFRSGVRIGIAVGNCVTYLNGALVVLGYGLLSVGLWLAADRLPLPSPGRLRAPRRSD
jgi:hypothetical protein